MASCPLQDYDATGPWGQYVDGIYCHWMSHRKGLKPFLESKHWTFCMSETRKIHFDEELWVMLECLVGLMHEPCESVFWDEAYVPHLNEDTNCAETDGDFYWQKIMHHWLVCKPEECIAPDTTAILAGRESGSVIGATASALPRESAAPPGTEMVERVDVSSATSEAEEDREITSLEAKERSMENTPKTENVEIEDTLRASSGFEEAFGDIDSR